MDDGRDRERALDGSSGGSLARRRDTSLAHLSQYTEWPREAPDSCVILYRGSQAELGPGPRPEPLCPGFILPGGEARRSNNILPSVESRSAKMVLAPIAPDLTLAHPAQYLARTVAPTPLRQTLWLHGRALGKDGGRGERKGLVCPRHWPCAFHTLSTNPERPPRVLALRGARRLVHGGDANSPLPGFTYDVPGVVLSSL